MARKTEAEARVERMTWYALVGVLLLVLYFDRDLRLPSYLAPLSISIVLIISSVYQQFVRNFQPSLVAWGVAIALILPVVYEIFFNLPFVDLRLFSILGVVIVILAGVITNEG